MSIFVVTIRRIILCGFLLGVSPLAAYCQIDCGQTEAGRTDQSVKSYNSIATEPITIDYAVFYTPEARDTEGGEQAMLTRIETAFQGANQIFASSGASIIHRVVHTQVLPINNTINTLPDLNTELATNFDFFTVLDTVNADSSVIVVKSQLPGGYANIPISPSQALRGGGINLGLPNLSASILAHEIGHTLGAGHDYADTQSMTYIPPTYNHGNHFIGAGTGKCYRTIMSALTTCRISGYQNMPADPCNLFSNPLILFDGTPTGDPINADAVKMFMEFAPFVGSSRGNNQMPNPDEPTPTPDDGNPDEQDRLTLKLEKIEQRIRASGRCVTEAGAALTGDLIELYLLNRRTQTEKLLKGVSCSAVGKYRTRLSRGGRVQARNTRTGTLSKIVRSR